MRFSLLVSLLVAATVLLFASTPVQGQLAPNTTDPITGQSAPLFAFCQIQYNSVTKINGVEQSFSSDFYMLTTWAAPIHDPTLTATDLINNYDLNALTASNLYWGPQLDFINAIGGVTRLQDGALSFIAKPSFDPSKEYGYTLPPGWVWCQEDQRYVGDFLTPVEMQDFPYDIQNALLLVESLWDYTQVKIVFAEPAKIALAHLFPPTMPDILGWKPLDATHSNINVVYDYNGRIYNRNILAIRLSRDPEFYLNKLVAGCIMLVVMCICLFFLTAEEADRLMGAFAIFAGLIAYLFVASVYTPVLPYSTALDQFLMLCFVEVIAISGVHASMFFYREREKLLEEKAEAEQAAAAEAEDTDGDDDEGEDMDHSIAIKSGGSHPASPMGQGQHPFAVPLPSSTPPISGNKVGDSSAVEMAPVNEANGLDSAAPVAPHSDRHHHTANAPPSQPSAVSARKPKSKRDRKRARKAAAAANAANAQVLEVHITNSLNPIRIWYNSLGLQPIRKIDFFFALFFSVTFIVGTAVIFGIPASKQRTA